MKDLESKNIKVMNEMDSNTFYLQGRALFIEKNFIGSAFSFIRSLDFLTKCERFDRIIPILNITIRTFHQMSKSDFIKLNSLISTKFEGKDFEKFLRDFEKGINSDSVILTKTNELRNIYTKNSV